jgi:RNase H-fold protein (predicted Holliday junction resolvase)
MTSNGGRWAALDPGRSKCGLVRCDDRCSRVMAALIAPADQCLERLSAWRTDGLEGVVLGDGTGSGSWPRQLRRLGLAVRQVNEAGSTLAARHRYWQLQPARGWRLLLPPGLRLPPRPLDDLAAQLLLERWLGSSLDRDSHLEVQLLQALNQDKQQLDQKRARTVKA